MPPLHQPLNYRQRTRQSAYNDRLETDLALAGILRRILRGERWWAQEDGSLLAIDDSVDLTPGERLAVLQAVREA